MFEAKVSIEEVRYHVQCIHEESNVNSLHLACVAQSDWLNRASFLCTMATMHMLYCIIFSTEINSTECVTDVSALL